MDWSILKPQAEHRFLRPELIYNFIPVRYFLFRMVTVY